MLQKYPLYSSVVSTSSKKSISVVLSMRTVWHIFHNLKIDFRAVRGAWVEIFCCYDENGADAPDFRRKNALAEASGAAEFAPPRP